MTKLFLFLEGIASWTGVIVSLALLIGVVVLIVWKLKAETIKGLIGQILIAVATLVFSFPLVGSITLIADNKVKSQTLSETSAELELIKMGVKNDNLLKENVALENEKLDQAITIKKLNEELTLLKNAQLSIEKFEEICEVALLEAELNQTDVRKQTLMSEKHISLIGNKYTGRTDKDILIIKTRNIIAKYGIDLSDVKVFESEEKLHISNITLKNVGLTYPKDKLGVQTIVSEIREEEYNAEGQRIKTTIINNADASRTIKIKEEEFENDWVKRISQDPESANTGLSQAVIELGKHFIAVILEPLGKEIVFEDEYNPEGVSIFRYLDDRVHEVETILKQEI